MTHQKEATLPEELMQLLCEPQAEHSRFANVLRLLLNEAMRLERATALQAQPYERTVERRGYASPRGHPATSPKHWPHGWDSWNCKCRRCVAMWTSILRHSNAAYAVNALSNWRLPRCMSRVSRPAKSRKFWNSFVA